MGFFDFSRKPSNKRRWDSVNNNAPAEQYIREEERLHRWECPHDDPEDCGCDGD